MALYSSKKGKMCAKYVISQGANMPSFCFRFCLKMKAWRNFIFEKCESAGTYCYDSCAVWHRGIVAKKEKVGVCKVVCYGISSRLKSLQILFRRRLIRKLFSIEYYMACIKGGHRKKYCLRKKDIAITE